MRGLLVCWYGSPCEVVVMLRYDPGVDAQMLLFIYERVERDEKVRLPPAWFMWRDL